MLLAVLGVGAIAVVVDLLAVALRRVALSGLPLLVLFAVPSAVLPGGLGVLPFLLCAAGWLGLLLADSADTTAQWGLPLRGARPSTTGRRASAGRGGASARQRSASPPWSRRWCPGSTAGCSAVTAAAPEARARR